MVLRDFRILLRILLGPLLIMQLKPGKIPRLYNWKCLSPLHGMFLVLVIHREIVARPCHQLPNSLHMYPVGQTFGAVPGSYVRTVSVRAI